MNYDTEGYKTAASRGINTILGGQKGKSLLLEAKMRTLMSGWMCTDIIQNTGLAIILGSYTITRKAIRNMVDILHMRMILATALGAHETEHILAARTVTYF